MVSSMTEDSRAPSMRARLHPSLQPLGSGVGGELGFNPDATLSLMSDFSAYGGINETAYHNMQMEEHQGASMNNHYAAAAAVAAAASGAPPPPPQPPPPPPPPGMSPGMSPMMESPSMRSGFDRRRGFAKMKYRGPGPPGKAGSQRSVGDGMPDIHMVDSNFSLLLNLSGHGSKHQGQDLDAMSRYSDHASEYMGVGSRRSLM
jgi:hypothetical protein